jgi:hypothetical protein
MSEYLVGKPSRSELEKYFVVSEGEIPHRIFFTFDDAINNDSGYIDSFDEEGRHLFAYMRVDERVYTDNF